MKLLIMSLVEHNYTAEMKSSQPMQLISNNELKNAVNKCESNYSIINGPENPFPHKTKQVNGLLRYKVC